MKTHTDLLYTIIFIKNTKLKKIIKLELQNKNIYYHFQKPFFISLHNLIQEKTDLFVLENY
jgi:hypothetical protein